MRSEWIPRRAFECLLMGLTYENRLALEVSLRYGLRIGDVLRMPSYALDVGKWSFKEQKTGKRRTLRLSPELLRELRGIAGVNYVFEHRTDRRRHRTRQAVWKDLHKVARGLGLTNVSPHSARKVYAVERFHGSGGDLRRVQNLLNHSDEAVTVLYAMADELARKAGKNEKILVVDSGKN